MSNKKIPVEYLQSLRNLVGSALLCMVDNPDIAFDVYNDLSLSLSIIGVAMDNDTISELHDKVRNALILIAKDVSKK